MSHNHEKFADFDQRGVRAFVRYSVSSGGFAIECYRKKTAAESGGESDWQMIREGHVQTYSSRHIAEKVALNMAEDICRQYGF